MPVHVELKKNSSAMNLPNDNANDNVPLQSENERLHALLRHHEETSSIKDEEVTRLKEEIYYKDVTISALKSNVKKYKTEWSDNKSKIALSKPVLYTLIFLTLFFAGFALYTVINPGNFESGSLALSTGADNIAENGQLVQKEAEPSDVKAEVISTCKQPGYTGSANNNPAPG